MAHPAYTRPSRRLAQATLAEARPVWLATVLGLCLTISLVLANVFGHSVVVVDTAEVDAYFLRAEELLRGQGYHDPYRPPLYVVLTALVSLLLDRNTFLAANLISSVATGCLAGLTYAVATRFMRPRLALLTQFLVTLDAVVLEHGLSGSTDALFAALSMAMVLVVVTQHDGDPRAELKNAAALGVLFALAYLTRYTAASFVLVIGWWIWTRRASIAWRCVLGCVTLLCAGAVALPWLLYNAKTNGSPFAHENWRNFAFALYGNGDFGYIDTVAYRGFVDVFLQNPNLVWRLWVHNVLTMARAVALMHTSSLLLAMFLPIGFAILRQRRDAAILGMYIVACILPTVATFRYTPRLVLGATPILILIGVIGLDYVIEQLPSYTTATVQARRLGRVTIWLTLVIITGSPVARLPILVASFVERQPVEEVEVLDRLVERLSVPRDKPIKVVSTYQYLAYFSNHPEAVVQTWAPPFDERFPGSIVSMSESQDADYILVSDRTASAVVASGAFDPVVPRCWVLEEDVLVQTGSIRLLKNACA